MYVSKEQIRHRWRYRQHDFAGYRRLSSGGQVRVMRRLEQRLLPFVLLSIFVFLLFSWLFDLVI